MKLWWTLPELASYRLPGLQSSKQGLSGYAKKAGWLVAKAPNGESLARKRQGRGGGFEFHVSLLPPAARIAIDAAHAPAAGRVEEEIVSLPAAPCAETARMRDARLAILGGANRLRAARGLSQGSADEAFLALYAERRDGLDEFVHELVPTLAARTLRRWRLAAETQDGARLGQTHGGSRRSKALEIANGGAVAIRIQRLVAEQPFFTARDLRKALIASFGATIEVGGQAIDMPSEKAVARYVAEWKAANKAALTKLTDPDGYRSRYRVSGGSRHGHVERLNQVWQIDASPADVLCIDGRHTFYACLDIWSRRVILYVTKTPRAEAVCLLLRKAILAWGLPETIETDNGSDFRAQETRRFLAAMGVAVDYCDAYSPWQKGHVERVIGTIQRSFGVWQPGFIGHSVADRKKIEARKSLAQRHGETMDDTLKVELTAADLQKRLDAYAENGYGLEEHSALGMAPFAKAATFTGKLRRVESERALDVLLYKLAGDGLRSVGKDGIRIDGATFINASLLPGEKVLVRLDPADLGRALCFSEDGATFLGEAVCPERAGIDRAAVTAKWRAEVERRYRDGLAEIRKDKRTIKLDDIAAAVARDQAEASGKLVSFPRGHDAHDTPQLAAASDATRRGHVREAKLTDEQKAKHAATVAAFEAEQAQPNVVPLKPAPRAADSVSEKKARYRDWLALAAREAAGEALSDDERHHLAVYPTTSEYRAIKGMVEDFGADWLDDVKRVSKGA